MPQIQPQVETEKYAALFGLCSNWRNKNTTKNGYKGILPFVSGLRFSVELLYIIRRVLENSQLDASWGHIRDKKNQDVTIFSNECDIIIYRKIPNSVQNTWNGQSMDFKFINVDAVVGVISCKSSISVSAIDKKYPAQLKPFSKNIWLFGEYCDFNTYDKIKKKAKKSGYKDFWCLYEWNLKKEPKIKIDSIEAFDKKLILLAKKFFR